MVWHPKNCYSLRSTDAGKDSSGASLTLEPAKIGCGLSRPRSLAKAYVGPAKIRCGLYWEPA
jgi:hypothetical protein